jgi:methylation protein EvaC
VLDLGKTPLADAFPHTAQEPEVYYPLVVVVCRSCTLVQLEDVVPDALLYGADYAFHSSASPVISAYHRQYGQWLMDRYGDKARALTVEIACNDGSLLSVLHTAGARVVGVDPATSAVEAARARGLSVVDRPFDQALAAALRDQWGPAGLVVANNVLAHVADLHGFLAAVEYLMAPDGVAVVEFQYLPDLLIGNQWDHVYHEHRFYLSVNALIPILRRYGLHIVHLLRTPMQGGSVRLSLTKAAGPVVMFPREDRLMVLLAGFQVRVDYLARRTAELVRQQQGRVAGYGATAKSATLLSYCGIGPSELEYIVDTTPGKVGRVTPGTHIPVVAPGDQPVPDVYLLTAWNYLGRVLSNERSFCDNGGRFLVPIPAPVLL